MLNLSLDHLIELILVSYTAAAPAKAITPTFLDDVAQEATRLCADQAAKPAPGKYRILCTY